MKRQFILVVMLMIMSSGIIKAQSVDDIFIIGTSIQLEDDDDNITGFIRVGPNSKPIYETPQNAFFIFSVEKEYYLFFTHYNFKQSERLKIVPYRRWDYMKTVTIPKSELSKFNLTDADEFLQEKSKYEAWQWAKNVKGSKKGIWVIDRNDDFVKNGIEYVILYEVYLVKTNEPVFEEEEEVS